VRYTIHLNAANIASKKPGADNRKCTKILGIYERAINVWSRRKFFSSLPLCSLVPDCGGETRLVWGSNRNKVLPNRNQVDWQIPINKLSLSQDVVPPCSEEQIDDPEDDTIGENDVIIENDLELTPVIPTTGIPRIRVVMEGLKLQTEKEPSINQPEVEPPYNQAFEKDNILNEEKEASSLDSVYLDQEDVDEAEVGHMAN
jgi:hypothetical protein